MTMLVTRPAVAPNPSSSCLYRPIDSQSHVVLIDLTAMPATGGSAVTVASVQPADQPHDADSVTIVPSAFFDELVADLDAPAPPSLALSRAVQRARDVVRPS